MGRKGGRGEREEQGQDEGKRGRGTKDGKKFGEREREESIYAPRGPLAPSRPHLPIAHSAKNCSVN